MTEECPICEDSIKEAKDLDQVKKWSGVMDLIKHGYIGGAQALTSRLLIQSLNRMESFSVHYGGWATTNIILLNYY